MLQQTAQATQPATVIGVWPNFVTTAYAWGFEDGATGQDRRGFLYWTMTDARYTEYSEGYTAGQNAAQRRRQ